MRGAIVETGDRWCARIVAAIDARAGAVTGDIAIATDAYSDASEGELWADVNALTTAAADADANIANACREKSDEAAAKGAITAREMAIEDDRGEGLPDQQGVRWGGRGR